MPRTNPDTNPKIQSNPKAKLKSSPSTRPKSNHNPNGKIIIPARANPWPHELRVARILADAGHVVEFIPEENTKRADILLDGTEYEIKSPLTNNHKKIIRNLKRALTQSPNVIIDSSRIKYKHDSTVAKLLIGHTKYLPALKKCILINKHEKIIDIK